MQEYSKKITQESNISEYPFLEKPIPIIEQSWNGDVQPLVSIYCKAYMHENFIRNALEGFLMQQTTFKVEIWIHDDASTDNTPNIIREYEAKYPHLFVATYQVENQYKKNPKTPNYIKPPIKRGKYVAPCEGDDYWTDPFKLQKQVDFMEKNPDYVMCYHYNQQKKGDILLPRLIPTKGKDFTGDELIATPPGIATATKLFRNVFLKYPNQNRPTGDYGLNVYLGLFGKCKFLSDIKPSVRRLHSGGVWTSKQSDEKHYGLINTKIKVYKFFSDQKDYHRMNVSLIALKNVIQEKLPYVYPEYKEFRITSPSIRFIHKVIKHIINLCVKFFNKLRDKLIKKRKH